MGICVHTKLIFTEGRIDASEDHLSAEAGHDLLEHGDATTQVRLHVTFRLELHPKLFELILEQRKSGLVDLLRTLAAAYRRAFAELLFRAGRFWMLRSGVGWRHDPQTHPASTYKGLEDA